MSRKLESVVLSIERSDNIVLCKSAMAKISPWKDAQHYLTWAQCKLKLQGDTYWDGCYQKTGGKGCGKIGTFMVTVGGNVKWHRCCGTQNGGSSKIWREIPVHRCSQPHYSQKQPKCPKIDEWINKIWYTMEYHSALTRKFWHML